MLWAHCVWQTLGETLPGHAAIASLLEELGDELALAAARAHHFAVLAAMGTAWRIMSGEPVPPERLVQDLRRVGETGKPLHAALRSVHEPGRALARRILEVGARTTAAEERLIAAVTAQPQV